VLGVNEVEAAKIRIAAVRVTVVPATDAGQEP